MKLAAIKENYEFRRVYGKGRSAVAATLVLYCRKNRLGHNRFGFTVGRKLGCAVRRNRVRRRLREIARLRGGELRTGYDLVTVVRGRGLDASYRTLEDDFLRLARKLELLR